mmetsp:Transcript_38502/g.77143  ORF Transcript_38502/g.77143 Transcript_38502/m.77143 type:complete len:103 (-) Transcript_38502:124-432(-)
MVEALWAIRRVLLPRISRSSASLTRRSLSLSSALVASSRMSTDGSLMIARAIATRCRCPPESCDPFSPTYVCIPSGSDSINCNALAWDAASRICSNDAPGHP